MVTVVPIVPLVVSMVAWSVTNPWPRVWKNVRGVALT